MKCWFVNWAPLIFLGLLTPFTPLLDMRVARLFYTPSQGFIDNAFCRFLFHYGEIFGFVICGCAIVLFALSWIKPRWNRWKRALFAILLSFIIGPGLLTNIVLKGQFARPRPKQVEEFGGKYAYRPFWKLTLQQRQDPQKSFPSGHVAMGFYFISLTLAGRRMKNKGLYHTGIWVSIGLGGGLMVVRVIQGGHFLSDVIAAPVLIWYVSLLIDRWTWRDANWNRLLLWIESIFRLKVDQSSRTLPCDQPDDR